MRKIYKLLIPVFLSCASVISPVILASCSKNDNPPILRSEIYDNVTRTWALQHARKVYQDFIGNNKLIYKYSGDSFPTQEVYLSNDERFSKEFNVFEIEPIFENNRYSFYHSTKKIVMDQIKSGTKYFSSEPLWENWGHNDGNVDKPNFWQLPVIWEEEKINLLYEWMANRNYYGYWLGWNWDIDLIATNEKNTFTPIMSINGGYMKYSFKNIKIKYIINE